MIFSSALPVMEKRKSKMHEQENILTVCISAFVLSGCAIAADKTGSPPSDTQWINVKVKNPSQYTKPFPLEVRNISHKCLKKRISGVDGSVITESNYNVINMPLQQGSNNIWKAKVALLKPLPYRCSGL